MKKIICTSIFIISVLIFNSCSSNNKSAQKHLENARTLMNSGYYDSAKLQIDSLKSIHPKAFAQIKASFLLMDTIRRQENIHAISVNDSLIQQLTPIIDSMKSFFVYDRNKEYQETGRFIPKEAISSVLAGTTLRPGVEENGQLFLESVYIGSQMHNKIIVKNKSGLFAETLPVEGDGFVFRFSNLGKQFETIHFAGKDENGVGHFIWSMKNEPLTITLSGQQSYSYALSQQVKNAVSKSVQLSLLMLQCDSLKTAKELAEYKIYSLDNKYNKKDSLNQATN